jgi:hypothetical protein
VFAFISALLSFVVNVVDTFVWPAVAQMQPSLILTAAGHFDQASTVFTSTSPLIITAVLCVIIGYTLFSVALWQAQVVPRAASVLLAVAAIFSAVGPGFIGHGQLMLNVLVYAPIAVALIWLGVVLWFQNTAATVSKAPPLLAN